MPKASVIIPVYNTEKFLDKCLRSVINQTLSDIEIICINDGSTDNSLEILNKYASKDNRIKIINQKNFKQGAARNRGLDIACGEFIAFVDSDDWIDLDYLEKLYRACIEYNTNSAAACSIREKKGKNRLHLKFDTKQVYCGINDIVRGIKKELCCWGLLYKREAVRDLRFRENVYYEDAPYTLKALFNAQSLVTVPDTVYHYVFNQNSTLKSKQELKHVCDKIINGLDLVEYAENNNIDIGDWAILKENCFLWKIKKYKNKTDYYLFGIKILSIKSEFRKKQPFLVFNTACMGDVLLCNSLCQNIKRIYPESYVVFIVDKPMFDAAKYQLGTDEVVVYDKRGEHKGFFGFLKFLKNFKYKKAYVSFVTYANVRNYLISLFSGARYIFSAPKYSADKSQQKQITDLITERTVNVPIRYEALNDIPEHLRNIVLNDKKYIGLCTLSKTSRKDMPVETAIGLIKLFNNTDYEIIYTGIGSKAADYSKKLKEANCNFIDLTDRTTIQELASVIKNCKGMVSVDTGTMHLSSAVACPVAAVFYEQNIAERWAPDPDLYKSVVIFKNQTPENIYNQTLKLLKSYG